MAKMHISIKFEQISFQKLELLEINGYIPAKDHIEDCRRGAFDC